MQHTGLAAQSSTLKLRQWPHQLQNKCWVQIGWSATNCQDQSSQQQHLLRRSMLAGQHFNCHVASAVTEVKFRH